MIDNAKTPRVDIRERRESMRLFAELTIETFDNNRTVIGRLFGSNFSMGLYTNANSASRTAIDTRVAVEAPAVMAA